MDYNIRTLNYLGSKLRLLDFIYDKVLDITPAGAGVCDLFAGSGCVSRKLSKDFPVTSCDIQAYSQVICRALLGKFDGDYNIDELIDLKQANQLRSIFAPLVSMERQAIEDKDLELLTCFLEHGSVEVFNREHAKSMLSDVLATVSKNLTEARLSNEQSLISRYYGGVYFSYKQAVEIDILLKAIHEKIPASNCDIYLAALLSTASDIVNTVGKHFAQPIKARDSKGHIKSTVYNKAFQDKIVNVNTLYTEWLCKYQHLTKNNLHHTSVLGDYKDCLTNLPENVKTVYADPPYTRDHYSRFYHVLETMTLWDSPEISMVTIHGSTHISNGIYRKERHQSPFCIKRDAPEAFRTMFKLVSSAGRNLLLSYSPYDETKKTHPRVVTMQQLIDMAKEFFSSVEIVSAGTFKHNKLNSHMHLLDASDEAELLIVCTQK